MRLGIVTSGGDAPGMNALVHGFGEACLVRSIAPVGVRGGLAGLLVGAVVDLSDEAFGPGIVGLGGTVIGTGRTPDLRSGTRLGVERLRTVLARPLVFVPATIDGDVPGSDASIGFDSAVDHGVRAIDDLRTTAAALPGRAFIVEVLGADCGRIAEAMAEATPVDAVLVPERPIDLDAVAAAMRTAMGRRYAIALMTEGCGEAGEMARLIGERMGARVRATVLGHGQRGTSPTARDRALGLAAGRLAVEALAAGRAGEIRIVAGAPVFEPAG